ncbi:hypothetical protein HZH66_006058 [Vespula vulgaris]|uniref:Uncharacterized protein n=1 Tax=Vespula vulgaris TaxID=7454 RepID=A0A834K9M4_VESVU|nr:hypothetical protein HZH66_006058 [Vespula vulgaris]
MLWPGGNKYGGARTGAAMAPPRCCRIVPENQYPPFSGDGDDVGVGGAGAGTGTGDVLVVVGGGWWWWRRSMPPDAVVAPVSAENKLAQRYPRLQ